MPACSRPAAKLTNPPNWPPWPSNRAGSIPAFVRELERESGLAIDFQELGAIDLAYSAEELSALEARAAKQAAMGIASQPVAPARVAAFWPRVRGEGLVGARFYPGDGLVNPREVVTALMRGLPRAGRRASSKTARVLRSRMAASPSKSPPRKAREIHQRGSRSLPAPGAVPSRSTRCRSPRLGRSEGHLLGYRQPAQTCNTIIRHGHTYLMQRCQRVADCRHIRRNRRL